jgi:hypothetical protein
MLLKWCKMGCGHSPYPKIFLLDEACKTENLFLRSKSEKIASPRTGLVKKNWGTDPIFVLCPHPIEVVLSTPSTKYRYSYPVPGSCLYFKRRKSMCKIYGIKALWPGFVMIWLCWRFQLLNPLVLTSALILCMIN